MKSSLRTLQDRITADLASSMTLEGIACVLADALAPALDATSASLYVLDDSETLARRVDTARTESEPASGRVASSVPLVVNERAFGAMQLGFENARTFGDDERAFLDVVADHCARAVYRARLYEDGRRAVLESALLYELLDAINKAQSLEQIYDIGIDIVRRAAGLERASILLFDEAKVMRFQAWRGLSDEYRRAVDGHSPWSAEERDPRPLLVEDIATDERVAPYRHIFARENIHALAFIPLTDDHRLVGKFMVYSYTPRKFRDNDVRLLESIGTQFAAGIARKNAQQALVAARTEAETANRTKDEFLAVVSHELRTPLATIAGWVALLRKSAAPAQMLDKGLDVIERAVRAQSTIVEDILDVSRIVTGNFVLERRPIDLVAVATEAVESSRAAAGAKRVDVQLDVPREQLTVVGDSDRLRQTIWNLLSNAIKFSSDRGVVTIALRREGENVVLSVRDRGAGIKPEFLPFVFDRFRQQDSSATRRHAGLGLGLAIVRRLVELHGGEVHAESEGLGRGATFTVSIPAAPVDSEVSSQRGASARDASFDRLDGVRVLVVEDDADTRDVISRLLSTLGATVVEADSVAMAMASLNHAHPDVIVSDVGMPEESGLSFARRLRTEVPGGDRIPAIALTAYARAQDEQNALSAGFDRYIAKPAPPGVLTHMVHELAEARRAHP